MKKNSKRRIGRKILAIALLGALAIPSLTACTGSETSPEETANVIETQFVFSEEARETREQIRQQVADYMGIQTEDLISVGLDAEEDFGILFDNDAYKDGKNAAKFLYMEQLLKAQNNLSYSDGTGSFLSDEVPYQITADLLDDHEILKDRVAYGALGQLPEKEVDCIFDSLKLSFKNGQDASEAYQRLWGSNSYNYALCFDHIYELDQLDSVMRDNFLKDVFGWTFEDWQEAKEKMW